MRLPHRSAGLTAEVVLLTVLLTDAGWGVPLGGQSSKADSRDKSLPRGAIARTEPIKVPFESTGPFALAPDGSKLAIAVTYKSGYFGVAIHDVTTGKTTPLSGDWESNPAATPPLARVTAIAFSPDGRSLLAALEGFGITLSNVDTGELYRWTEEEGQYPPVKVNALAFSPDGKLVAEGRASPRFVQHRHGVSDTGRLNTTVILWDATMKRKIHEFEGPSRGVNSVSFSPDGRTMWAGGVVQERSEERIQHWDVATGKRLAWKSEGFPASLLKFDRREETVNTLAVTPDGTQLITGTADGQIRFWDPTTGEQVRSMPGVRAWLSPDGKMLLLSLNSEAGIHLWDSSTNREIRKYDTGRGAPEWAAVSRDGQSIFVATSWKEAYMIRAADGQKTRIPGGVRIGGPVPRKQISTLTFSPDGKYFATVGPDTLNGQGGTIHFWDGTSGKEIPLPPEVAQQDTGHLAFAPDGKKLATGWSGDLLSVWELSEGKLLRHLKKPSSPPPIKSASVPLVAFSPDGRLLAAANRVEGDIQLWDAATGAFVRRFTMDSNPRQSVTAVTFSSDGKRIGAASPLVRQTPREVRGRTDIYININTQVRYWDVATGQAIVTLTFSEPSNVPVAFSPNDRMLATANQETIRLRDTAAGTELRKLVGPKGTARCLAFSPDGKLLVSGWSDQTVQMWEVSTGRPLRTLGGHSGQVTAVGFSPDGKKLAAGSDDGTALVWSVAGAR